MSELKNAGLDMARDLQGLFMLTDIKPEDTIASAVAKFRGHGSRYHLLFLEDGGMICLCSDAGISRRLHAAIRESDELDRCV